MLNTRDGDLIEQAVAAAEMQTRSEIMVCVLPASSEDRGIAGIIAMLSAGLVLLFLPGAWPEMNIWVQSALATSVGAAIFLAMDYFDLGLKLLPHGLTARHARRAARAAFLDLGLDATPERSAVLLFVSRAERYVEIVADRGLAASVPPDRWSEVIANFQATARRKGMVEATAQAVGGIGAICAEVFPVDPVNPDTKPNRPVGE